MVLTVGVAAVASLLTPEGKLRRDVHFLLALAIVAALLSPLGTGIRWTQPSLSDSGSSTYAGEEDENAALTAAALSLRSHLAAEFSLAEEEIGVSVGGKVTDAGELSVRRVTVVLSGESAGARLPVLEYLQAELTGIEVTVYVG